MARVELILPDKFIFEAQLIVRASDLNYGNHVGNDRILTLMQEARVLFYQSLGFKNEMSFEGSIGHVIADAVVVYKSESFLGDVLKIEIATTDFSKYSFDIYYRITNQHNKEVAHGKTGVVCFDFEKRKVAPVPQKLLEKLVNPM
ncbi:MAG TPA: thioesterase family protein [Cyclobacteriaceae bacterium]|nr:thioesterase family protein [Cyclobacteriaceae bacterium]